MTNAPVRQLLADIRSATGIQRRQYKQIYTTTRKDGFLRVKFYATNCRFHGIASKLGRMGWAEVQVVRNPCCFNLCLAVTVFAKLPGA